MVFTRELTEMLLDRYRCQDSRRQNLIHFMPVIWNSIKWSAATNAYEIMLVPENAENVMEPPTTKTWPDIPAIMPDSNMNFEITVAEFMAAYNSIPLVNTELTDECPSCDGEGNFEHYGEHYDCKTCNKTGKAGTKEFKYLPIANHLIQFNTSHLKPEHVLNLIWVCEILKIDKVIVLFSASNKFMVQVGEVVILISGSVCGDDCKAVEIKKPATA